MATLPPRPASSSSSALAAWSRMRRPGLRRRPTRGRHVLLGRYVHRLLAHIPGRADIATGATGATGCGAGQCRALGIHCCLHCRCRVPPPLLCPRCPRPGTCVVARLRYRAPRRYPCLRPRTCCHITAHHRRRPCRHLPSHPCCCHAAHPLRLPYPPCHPCLCLCTRRPRCPNCPTCNPSRCLHLRNHQADGVVCDHTLGVVRARPPGRAPPRHHLAGPYRQEGGMLQGAVVSVRVGGSDV